MSKIKKEKVLRKHKKKEGKVLIARISRELKEMVLSKY